MYNDDNNIIQALILEKLKPNNISNVCYLENSFVSSRLKNGFLDIEKYSLHCH